MPSTIRVTTALKDACTELLRELHTRAETHALDAQYHVVSTWASALLRNPNQLSAAAVAAQHEFSAYPVNERWLAALDDLIHFGGEDAGRFMITLCRYYLLKLPQVEESLWQQYSSLQRKVTLETSRRLPESWGEWDRPMQALFESFERHLQRQEPVYAHLLNAPSARTLADITAPHMLVPGGPLPTGLDLAGADVDDSAALTSYLEWCREKYEWLEAEGLQGRERSGLRLEAIFIPRRLERVDDWAEVRSYVRYQLIAQRQNPPRGRLPPNHRDASHENPPPPGPITQVLNRAVRLLVLAGPGEGKTTLLRHLALQHANLILADGAESVLGQQLLSENHRVPLYLHLAEYAERANVEQDTLLDYLLRVLGEESLRDPAVPGLLHRLLEQGRCLVLLDGLDTVVGDHRRRLVAARISQLAAQGCADSQANRVLVAMRPNGCQIAPLWPDFETYSLARFNREEIGEALMRWSLATERARHPLLADETLQRQAEQAAIAILRVISVEDSLREMASIPLLLRLIAERHQEGTYLAPRRAGILRAAAEAMIHEWRLVRGASRQPQVQEAEVRDLLSHLAYWLHDRRSSGTASEAEVAERLSTVWLERHPEADQKAASEAVADFLATVRHHGGLLAEVRPRHYGFVHPSMEEYFAARFLVGRYRLAGERIRDHLHDPRWDEVVRLAVSFVALDSPSDASDLLDSTILAWPNGNGHQAFPSSPFENVLKRDLLFASSLLAEGVEPAPDLMRRMTQQLVDLWILGDRDSAGRFDAILDQARKLLMALDGTAAGQLAMHYALSYAGDERAPVRASLADALTFWPSQAALAMQTLVRMGKDTSAVVRRAVGEALGRMDVLTPEAHVLLLSMVSDQDVLVREVARRSLSNAGPVPPSAMKVWVRLLHDEDPGKRQLGARVLQRVGSLQPLVVGELLALLSDSDPRVRSTVADTLATVEHLPDDALIAICRTIGESEDEVKAAAIEALARSVELPDEVVNQLIIWSREPDADVRLAATRALDACRNLDEPVIHALMDRSGDDSLNVRLQAIEALGRKGAGNPRVAHLLLHFTTETNPGVKISGARALGHLGELTPEGMSYLAELLQDFHRGVRQAALEAAALLGAPDDKILPGVVDMTTADDSDEAIQAAKTLAAFDGLPVNALVALVDSLPAHTDELAVPIATCLKRHSPLPAEVVHPLIDLALDGAAEVRHVAIEVLGLSLHAVPGVLEVLLGLAADPEVSVRAEAITALCRARDLSDHALDTLFEMLEGPPLLVRQTVAVTLTKLSRTLPHLDWNERRMEYLTDRLYQLLDEIPPRASWEPDIGGQNAVFEALRWLASRYGPEL